MKNWQNISINHSNRINSEYMRCDNKTLGKPTSIYLMVGFLLFNILELKKEEVRTHEDTVLKTAGCKNFTGWIPVSSAKYMVSVA